MIDFEDYLFVPISDFMLQAIGKRPYLMDENFIAPEGDYLALQFVEIQPIAWCEGSSYKTEGENGTYNYYATYEAMIRLVGYGKTSLGNVQSVCMGFREKRLTNILRQKNIAYFGHTPVRNTSYKYADQIERRYETILKIRFVQGGPDRGEDPGYIDEAGATATYI